MVNASRDRAVRAIDWTGEHVVTRVHTVRRRMDMAMLRGQARLESPRVDRYFPWFLAALAWLVFSFLALTRLRDLGLPQDLGHYLQALHLLENGMAPQISDFGMNLFAVQAAFIFVPIIWLTRLFPPAETMLVLQAFALALAVVPLWRITRQPGNLRIGAAGALVAAYFFHPSVQNLNLAGFHPEAFALPALLAAYLQGQKERWWVVSLLAFLVVVARSDLGLAVMALGLVFVGEERRNPGWFLASFGLLWFLIMGFFIQPLMGLGEYPHLVEFAAYGDGVFGVIGGMLVHPLVVLGDLFERSSFEKVMLLVAPVLFLPLVRMRYIAPVLPLLAFFLLADVSSGGRGNPEQDVAILPFVFIAATYALMRIGQPGVRRVLVDRRVLAVLALTATMFFVRDAASSPYEEPWNWGERDAADLARFEAINEIDDYDRVLAHPAIFNLVAERETIRSLPLRDTSGGPYLPSEDMVAGIDVVVFDGPATRWPVPDRKVFGEALRVLGFDETFTDEGIRVFVRHSES